MCPTYCAATPRDWTCTQCNANCYANRHACFRCGGPKVGNVVVTTTMFHAAGGGGGGGGAGGGDDIGF
jgi:hypothetical protein